MLGLALLSQHGEPQAMRVTRTMLLVGATVVRPCTVSTRPEAVDTPCGQARVADRSGTPAERSASESRSLFTQPPSDAGAGARTVRVWF